MGKSSDDHNPTKDAGGGSILEAARASGGRGPAPVHLWDPPYCGEMDLVIRADGRWIHDGRQITRPEMVRLFASILKREGDAYFLVTPVEKLGITVEDAPFLAQSVAREGDEIVFVTNMDERLVMGHDHPLIIRGSQDEPRPYLHVRGGLEALIDRKTFYRLVDLAEADAQGRLQLHSGGYAFTLEG